MLRALCPGARRAATALDKDLSYFHLFSLRLPLPPSRVASSLRLGTGFFLSLSRLLLLGAQQRFLEIFTFVYEDDREKYSGPMIMSPSSSSPAGARFKQSPGQLDSLGVSPAAAAHFYSHRVH